MNFNIYSGKNYKRLFVIPIILLVISLFFVTQLTYGMDFKGGSQITVPLEEAVDVAQLEININSDLNVQDLSIKQTTGLHKVLSVEYVGNRDIISAEKAFDAGNYELAISEAQKVTGEIETDSQGAEKAKQYINTAEETFKNNLREYISKEVGVDEEDFSFTSVGAALGSRFLEQSQNAVIAALILIAILVFYFFRNPIISIGVFQAAVYDLLIGLGAAGLLGIPITLGTIAALLMLIGYSIDSDIMLTDRILNRKKGEPHERAFSAMKTGLTMTGTSLGAVSVLFIVSYVTQIQMLVSISTILLIGLLGDIVATWFTNVPLILWYLERGESK